MKSLHFFRSCLLFCLTTLLVQAQTNKLTPRGAKSHVGERATVCGVVASTHYADRSKGQPTFLNLDEPYPRQIFTVVIWGIDRPKFGEPDRNFQAVRLCITGTITSFKGVPEIAASDPRQIEVQK